MLPKGKTIISHVSFLVLTRTPVTLNTPPPKKKKKKRGQSNLIFKVNAFGGEHYHDTCELALVFEIVSPCAAQAGLEFVILLPVLAS